MTGRASRIVLVTPGLSDQGGIASVVRSYLDSRLSESWDIEVIETVRGEGIARHLRAAGGVARACWSLGSRSTCLVHVHMSSGGSFWRKSAVVCCARVLGRPCILHLHGSRFHTWAGSGSALRKAWVRRVFNMPGVVIVLSDSWKRRVEEFSGRDDAVVVPNPVKIPAAMSAGLGTGTVVFLGRLGERKGVYELVEAIRLLQDEGVRVNWVLAGDGEVERVRGLVAGLPRADLVEVPGWLSHGDVSALLATAGVFCLPSTDEGLPIALLESMAYGLACVVTAVGGIPEVIEDGVNGVIVPVRDPDGLVQGLRRVLGSPILAERLGSEARRTVGERYAVEKVVERLGALYAECGCSARQTGG